MTHLPEAFFLTIFGLVAILPADTRKYAESQPVSHPVHVTAYKPDIGGDKPVVAGARDTDLDQGRPNCDSTNLDPNEYWFAPWTWLTIFTVCVCLVSIFWLKRGEWI